MNPTFTDLLLTWTVHKSVIAVLLITSGFYLRGWWHLRQKGYPTLATKWRLRAYLGGQVTIAIALLSAIDSLQSSLFLVHMIQHLLLMMVAAPLLWLGNPLVIGLWGLPRYWRLTLGRLLSKNARFRKILAAFTPMGISWMIYIAIMWLWHDSLAYQAALSNDLIHQLEHLTFFFSALLFWWHVIGAAPHIHKRYGYGARIGLVMLTMVPNEILAVYISLSATVLYPHYETVPRLWGIDALTDQALGGVIMWIPGGMMYALAIVLLFVASGLTKKGERKRISPES
jgi:cytochrome c oxidase assembly factor CtaG